MMKYKKVFSSTRFATRSQSNFSVDQKLRYLTVGSREGAPRTAFLGKVIEQGRTSNILDYGIYCDISFPHVVGIFGSRGSGKSFDLGVFLEEIFDSQRQITADAAIVFDVQDQFWTLAHMPKGELEEDAQQLKDLSAWGIEPRCVSNLNMWVPEASDTQVPNATRFSIAANQLNSADWLQILELERYSAMGQALLTLLEERGPATPQELMEACEDASVQDNFHPSTMDGIRWRLGSLANSEIISSTGIDVDDMLQPGTLTVVLMRNLSDELRALVVGVISRLVADRLGRVHQARKVARRTGEVVDIDSDTLAQRLWLVLDEAHVLVPSDGTTAATNPLIDYVKRGRDAGLSLIFATQQPSAVSSKLLSQVDLTITHFLGFDADIGAAIARMPTRTSVEYELNSQKVGSLNDVIRSLGAGEAFIADGASERVFVAKIRPRASAHGGSTPQ